jgi:hypothetical protein
MSARASSQSIVVEWERSGEIVAHAWEWSMVRWTEG